VGSPREGGSHSVDSGFGGLSEAHAVSPARSRAYALDRVRDERRSGRPGSPPLRERIGRCCIRGLRHHGLRMAFPTRTHDSPHARAGVHARGENLLFMRVESLGLFGRESQEQRVQAALELFRRREAKLVKQGKIAPRDGGDSLGVGA
jgi:hypothetical protein